jgi:hypothetical protein
MNHEIHVSALFGSAKQLDIECNFRRTVFCPVVDENVITRFDCDEIIHRPSVSRHEASLIKGSINSRISPDLASHSCDSLDACDWFGIAFRMRWKSRLIVSE